MYSTGYTIIKNECFLDARIAPEALGMLCYMAHRPGTEPDDLVKRFRVDREMVDQILSELAKLGYVTTETPA